MVRGLADIGAEAVLLAGAGSAILLQVADPAVGRGVAEHSNFAERPLDRLAATMGYVYAVIYGSEEQLTAVRRAVNRAHAPVRGTSEGASPGYNAFDPASQLWVVATLYNTAVSVYERVYGTLDGEAADRVYREYARIGTALQLPADLWPADRAAFAGYWNERLAGLAPAPEAVRVARELLNPAVGPAWLRVVMPLVRLLTAGLLTESIRAAYGLPWGRRQQRSFDGVMRVLVVVYPRLPRRIRHLPRDYYLGRIDVSGVRPHAGRGSARPPVRKAADA
ncbi:oxygenase MpaB family protein [Arthrobacter celericrescens]|uniref:oxygenase MpaB family protein n=1 Tax=Arthrobacter celericrescens TaxID=2320851 RepID=UPI000EA1FEED|nr:oxygenase MpaB family protein [Arthrobacter celericrescens]